MDDETFLLQLTYCIAGVLLFLIGSGWIKLDVITKIRRRFSPIQRQINDLELEIQQHRAELANIPIMDQFAANRKKQRIINKLADDHKALITQRDSSNTKLNLAWIIVGKGMCVSFALYLASQSSDLTVLRMNSSHFYPFNFLLSYPNLTSDSNETCVSLFSFAILTFLVGKSFYRRVIVGKSNSSIPFIPTFS